MITPTINYDYSKLDGIYNHFGRVTQLEKMLEESVELSHVLIQYAQGKATWQDVLKELSDNLNVALGLYHATIEDREYVDTTMLEKQIRTLERIEEGYYEKNK